MSLQEMIEKFDIKDIHKAGAVLDPVKLDWMNGEYIRRMNIEVLYDRLAKYLEQYESDFFRNIFHKREYGYNISLIRELQTRIKRLDEYIGLTKFLYEEPKIAPELFINPKMKIETEEE